MIPRTTLHGSSQQQERARAALEAGHANNAARADETPVPAGTRAQIAQRLGMTDASDEQLLGALDSTLAAAKAKRDQPSAADALYAAAWGDSTPTTKAVPTATATEADALAVLAWADDKKAV